jgi:hypothetical protein
LLARRSVIAKARQPRHGGDQIQIKYRLVSIGLSGPAEGTLIGVDGRQFGANQRQRLPQVAKRGGECVRWPLRSGVRPAQWRQSLSKWNVALPRSLVGVSRIRTLKADIFLPVGGVALAP